MQSPAVRHSNSQALLQVSHLFFRAGAAARLSSYCLREVEQSSILAGDAGSTELSLYQDMLLRLSDGSPGLVTHVEAGSGMLTVLRGAQDAGTCTPLLAQP